MNRFAWRQHRKQFLVFAIILALYAALIIPTGLHFSHAYHQALASCAQNPATPSCSNLSNNLFQTNIDQILFHLVPLAVLFLPLIFGMFFGAPFLAREYADGTNSLVWTQSVSRRKWLTVKLAWLLGATTLFMASFAALITWWSNTPNAINLNRFSNAFLFSSQGIVPIAYGLFAVAIGTLFGAWFRKTMVAVGIVIGLFIAVELIAIPNFVRPYYMTPTTVTAPMGPNALSSKIPDDAWIISMHIIGSNGQVFDRLDFPNMPAQCQQIIQQAQAGVNDGRGIHIKAVLGNGDPLDNCLNKAGYHQLSRYQPAYRYWDFQRIETGIYLGLAALAVGATYIIVLKRDA